MLEDIINTDNFDYFSPRYMKAIGQIPETQAQTADAFNSKWGEMSFEDDYWEDYMSNQKDYFFKCYGFHNEDHLKEYLKDKKYILDAGAGKCAKSAWLASICPESTIIAIDISDQIKDAYEYYKHIENIIFIQGDISNMYFLKNDIVDFTICDMVLHHTSDPAKTFEELYRVTKPSNEIACYVYKKKALPRELLDEHFRELASTLTHEQLMILSKQLTKLGETLDSINKTIYIPDIPLLGIEGGYMTIQRFLYWNFIKCYWNKELGHKYSTMVNYDWYSPSQAYRYTLNEFLDLVKPLNIEITYLTENKASYSGRFKKI